VIARTVALALLLSASATLAGFGAGYENRTSIKGY
jgi:hypothetical protein